MKRIRISIIIPRYNENLRLIEQTIKRIGNFLTKRNLSYEILISQNGKEKKLPQFDKRITLIFDKKRGLGLAIKNAIKKARGEYFYFLPADIPFNFTDLEIMLKLSSSADFIFGSKLHPQSVYQINFLRKFFTLLQQKITVFLLPGLPAKDPNGTYFGTLKKTKDLILKTKSNDFFFGTELLYNLYHHNLTIKEIPVVYKKLNLRTTVNLSHDGLNYLKQLIQLYFQSLKRNHK